MKSCQLWGCKVVCRPIATVLMSKFMQLFTTIILLVFYMERNLVHIIEIFKEHLGTNSKHNYSSKTRDTSAKFYVRIPGYARAVLLIINTNKPYLHYGQKKTLSRQLLQPISQSCFAYRNGQPIVVRLSWRARHLAVLSQ